MVGAILAGGRSRRMAGLDKTAMLRDGERVLVRTARLLSRLCGTCVLVAREEQAADFERLEAGEVCCDLFPGRGPLGGLYTALEETGDDVFLAACDLPFLEDSLLARLQVEFNASRCFAVVPRSPDPASVADPWRVEPLCAVWSRHCRRPAYVALEAGELSVSQFARQLPAKFVELSTEEASLLRNLNSQEDLRATGGAVELPGYPGET